MTHDQKKIPKRRFKTFETTPAWEQRKLGEVAENFWGGGTPNTNVVEFWDGNIPWIQSSDLSEGVFEAKENRKYISESGLKNSATKLVPKNSIAIVTRVGVGKLAFLNYDYTTSQDFLSLSDLKIEPLFAIYAIYKQLQKLKQSLQGTSIKGITKEGLLSSQISVPKMNSEQTAIGNFFQTLDRSIALHQRKLDKSKELKKAYLTEMFPAEGETVPKRRFPGFSGPWQERKLRELSTSFSGGTPSVGNKEYYGGDIPFIRSAEINSDKTELFLTELGLKNSSAKIVNKGDILYALYGATSGEVGISQINGAINQAILAIIPNSSIDSNFIMQWLRAQKTNIIEKYLQGGQGNLSGSIIKNLDILTPSLPEQTAIGNFFQKLDQFIAQQQEQLDKLKDLKKAYLTDLFP